jgi:hypothetical protein
MALVCLVAGSPWTASAQSSTEWDEDWPRFRSWEYASLGIMVGGIAVFSSADPRPNEGWNSTLPGDDWVREGLRAETRLKRTVAARASDVFLYALVAYPLVDAGLVSARNSEMNAGGQMALISAQSLAFTALTQRVISTASGRARPYARGCAEDPEYRRRCDTPDRNRSFFSGHTALAFTGAGLTCAHHLNVRHYGRVGGGIVCGTALAMATATGALRIVSDRHYLSDVVVGAAWGFASGYLLPVALHYGFGAPDGEARAARRRRPAVFQVTFAF